MTALANNRWDEASYQRIAAASGQGSELSVTFENGDELRFDIGRLVALGGEAPDWAALRTEPFEVEFEFGGEEVILSWLSIRSLLDDELAAHLARSAESEAEQVGHRLRVLRERRGLSGRQLAERVGIAPQSLSRIERGRHDIVFSKVQQLLAAMSYNLSDLEAASAIEVAPSRIRKALAQAGLNARTIERVLFGLRGQQRCFAAFATSLDGLPPTSRGLGRHLRSTLPPSPAASRS
jgi:transcriptional regulator with XRE-family HTH domain